MSYLRRSIPFLFPLLAACGGLEDGSDVGTRDLTGLYLGEGKGKQQDRICMVTAPSGAVRFGIVTMERDRAACSGIGRVKRQGAEVTLIMGGDEDCAIRATIEGVRIKFPASISDSCTYYCSAGATLAGKRFEKTEDTAEAALRAADLVGDPLCD